MTYFMFKESRIKKKLKLLKTNLEDKLMTNNLNLCEYDENKDMR